MADVGEISLAALAGGEMELVAEAISAVENGEVDSAAASAIEGLVTQLPADARQRIGITGSPGVGKSTLTGVLIKEFRNQGRKVGVLAVDPSSVISGGSLLGDRIRMHEHYRDSKVFIRSMSARGHLGGLARATPLASKVLTLAGYSPVIVETVGVGQSEVEVMHHVDTTLLVLSPGAGDDIQSAKAGIMEVADIFVINKSDRDLAGAQKLRQEIIRSQEISQRSDGWVAPVVIVSALERSGISELLDALTGHQQFRARITS
ncbi:MAG: methylmalonyl Co-A mutase-associated GTPase MeaB [Actinomycetota bacterium]